MKIKDFSDFETNEIVELLATKDLDTLVGGYNPYLLRLWARIAAKRSVSKGSQSPGDSDPCSPSQECVCVSG